VDSKLKRMLLSHVSPDSIQSSERIQSLWSGYGELLKVYLSNTTNKSIIVKHVMAPSQNNHPRGWNSNLSHLRKLKSYQVELHFYQHFAANSKDARVPLHLWSDVLDNEFVLALEDLTINGFPCVLHSVNSTHIEACIQWLANFHAAFLGIKPDGLWKTGTYWHLDTRPEELDVLKDEGLKKAAVDIDRRLNECAIQTLVHGDAKLANFCFSEDGRDVAAVDFQYVGGGCGMKDLAYFVGSCLSEQESEALEGHILDLYFNYLGEALTQYDSQWTVDAIRNEWQPLYRVAWADFHRFLKGWSPQHWKINDYSERICRDVILTLDKA